MRYPQQLPVSGVSTSIKPWLNYMYQCFYSLSHAIQFYCRIKMEKIYASSCFFQSKYLVFFLGVVESMKKWKVTFHLKEVHSLYCMHNRLVVQCQFKLWRDSGDKFHLLGKALFSTRHTTQKATRHLK